MDMLPIRRAILSVTDKSGLDEFARFLQESGVELVSTGGTRKKLLQAGLKVRSVSDVTGFPEILGGRVKTLHPHVHAGILASKDDPAHMQTMKDLRLAPFDLVCVNLYNFAEAVRQSLENSRFIRERSRGRTRRPSISKPPLQRSICRSLIAPRCKRLKGTDARLRPLADQKANHILDQPDLRKFHPNRKIDPRDETEIDERIAPDQVVERINVAAEAFHEKRHLPSVIE